MRGGRKEYQAAAEAMVASGMVKAGYTLMSTVCTGWLGRDPVTKELQQNLTNWPGGMKDFADFLHARGMELSVYTDAAATNCCEEPGSAGYEDVDMRTFASWGVDAVGIDYCSGPQDVRGAYAKFASAIVKSGRAMQLGMWNLGRGQAWRWAPAMSANMTAASQQQQPPQPGVFSGSWVPHLRLTRDIGNIWDGRGGPTESVMATVDEIQSIQDLWNFGMGNQSGAFPNYGQLVVGVPRGHPSAIDPGLTLTEAQSHFSLWCIFGSLLLATNNVSQRDPAIEAILLNDEAIAVNQDPWAMPAFRINASATKRRSSRATAGAATTHPAVATVATAATGTTPPPPAPPPAPPTEQWGRLLAGGDVAALILNRHSSNGDPSISARLDFADLLVAAQKHTSSHP